jgi:hypothetical protein
MTDSLSTGTNHDPTSSDGAPSAEAAAVALLPYLVVGLVASLPLLFVPTSATPLVAFTAQLSLVVLLSILATVRVMPLVDGVWFNAYGWSASRRRFGATAALVVMVTGVVALVTLASSAALRLTPSLQFLQLLSALDIAWAGAALMIGVRWLRGTRPAYLAGSMLALVCVLSVWNYLRVVGFGPSGEWVVDAGEMMRLVLPFDMVAAVMALTAVGFGVRRAVN